MPDYNPEEYFEIPKTNRLKSAMAEYPVLEEQMHVEDEYLEEWRRQKIRLLFSVIRSQNRRL